MASGSVLPPTSSDHTLPNGLSHSSHSTVMDALSDPFGSESPLSEPPLPSDDDITAAGASEDYASNDELAQELDTSETDDDEDAAGEKDEEYAEDNDDAADSDQDVPARRSSSSTTASSKSLKRKASAEDDDFMLNDPELYGMRRSGRNKTTRRTLADSDDDEDDFIYSSNNRAKRAKTKASSHRNSNFNSKDHSSEESDGDEDEYGSARSRALTKKNRRKMKNGTSGYATPDENTRFSNRNQRSKVTNYNLDQSDEDDFLLEDTDPAYWVDKPVDPRPAIDKILNHRLKDGVDTQDPGKDDYQYLVKYQGQAPYHAKWEDRSELVQPRVGFRRFDNYYKSVVLAEKIIMDETETSLEQRELWLLDRETSLDALTENTKVERIVAQQRGAEGLEYLVKWKALQYEEATWEKAALVSELAQHELDKFLDRSAQLPQCDKKEKNPDTRSDYKKIGTQPSYIKHGQLREFQMIGLNWLIYHWCKDENVILADEMGLGKTVQTVSFLNYLIKARGQEGPFLVVVPLSTLPAWADTFNNWTPNINYVVYNGSARSREVIREHEMCVNGDVRKPKFNVLLTTYESVNSDSAWLGQYKWQYMAVDEAHRLKNRNAQLYGVLNSFSAPARLLITGTPMQNTLEELSALMDFLAPGKIQIDANLDLDGSVETSQKLKELSEAIEPYILRRTKAQVVTDLPEKTEKTLRVPLTELQVETYQNIITRNYDALNAGPKAPKASMLNIMIELKKVSNHLLLFPPTQERLRPHDKELSREDLLKVLIGGAGKMIYLDNLLTKLKREGHRVLIFSQMVKMLDVLSEYMQLRGYHYQRLDGTMMSSQRKVAIDHYNAPDSQDFVFLLSTRAGGLGINLMTADTVVLFDSDWNPQADLQAMARAHRIGQKKPVTVYRFVARDSVEEEILESARNKLLLEYITMQRGNNPATDGIKDLEKRASNPTSAEEISRILKKRGEKMFQQSDNQKTLDELDIDAVLDNAELHTTDQPQGMTTDGGAAFLRSFQYMDVKLKDEDKDESEKTWDQIIPKDRMDKINEEKREKANQAYLKSVIAENQPRKRKNRSAEEESRDERVAKKRARQLAAEADASDGDIDMNDPQRPLDEKELRNLIRAFERYGYIEDKQTEIIREARLFKRDIDLVKSTMQQILTRANELVQEEKDRIAELERTEGRAVNKKDKASSLLFDFGGVKRLNAQTIVERPEDMRMLRNCIASVNHVGTFRIAEATKAASYTSEWGAKEDGMLAVGVAKHGYGAWTSIRDDNDLQLGDKLFLEEHRVDAKDKRKEDEQARSPGAVHLVRRIAYLFSVLRDKTSGGNDLQAKRALENHHRSKPKAEKTRTSTPSGRGSEVPLSRKSATTVKSGITKAGITKRRSPDRPGSSAGARAVFKGALDKAQIITLLKPVMSSLKKIQNCTKKIIPDKTDRILVLKENLIVLGDYLKESIPDKLDDSPVWTYVAKNHWVRTSKEDNNVDGDKVRSMYNNLASEKKQETAKATSSEAPGVKKESSTMSSIPKDQLPSFQKSKTGRPSWTPPGAIPKDQLPSFQKRDSNTPDLSRVPNVYNQRRDTSSAESRKERPSTRPLSPPEVKKPWQKTEKKTWVSTSASQTDRRDRYKPNDRVDSYRPVDRRERSPDRRDSREYRDYRDRRPPPDRRGSDHRDMPRGSEYRDNGRRDDQRGPARQMSDSNGRDAPRSGIDKSRDAPRNSSDPSSRDAPRSSNGPSGRDAPRYGSFSNYDSPRNDNKRDSFSKDTPRSSHDSGARDPPRYGNLSNHDSSRNDTKRDGISKEAPRPANSANGHKPSDRSEHPLPSKPDWQKRPNLDANGSRDNRQQSGRPGSSGGDFYRGSAYSDRPLSRGHRDNFDDRRFDDRYDDHYNPRRYRDRDDLHHDRDRDRGYHDRRR